VPIATSDAASWRASLLGLHEGAPARLDIDDQRIDPLGIFLLMIDAVMSGTLSTVPVTSRSA